VDRPVQARRRSPQDRESDKRGDMTPRGDEEGSQSPRTL
jgi:hypothetical protein